MTRMRKTTKTSRPRNKPPEIEAMKTLLALAFALLISSHLADAQEKLWTWKPSGGVKFRTLHVVSFSADGGAAFVIGVSKPVAPNNSTYQLVWVDRKGRQLLSKELPATGDFLAVQLLDGAVTPWEIVLLAPDKLALKDGKRLRLFESAGGQIKATTLPLKQDVLFFGGGRFEGWLQRETKVAGVIAGIGPNGGNGNAYDIISLSGWKF